MDAFYLHQCQFPLAMAGSAFLAYFVLKFSLHILRGIRSFLLSPLLNLAVNPATFGDWAVVTGSTDGIGKAYAFALAKKGMKVVLISRTQSKLVATANEIREKTGVEAKCVSVDFSGGVEVYSKVEEELAGLDIGILVNNVGMAYDYPEYFHCVENKENLFRRLINVNINSVVFMTNIVLPKLLEKQKGAILNIGSFARHGMPLFTVYAATKAFVDSFSRNLAYEYQGKGLIIQSILPQFIATKMTKTKKARFGMPLPDTYVKSQLATLGLEDSTSGYISHWFLNGLLALLPESWYMKAMMSFLKNGRDRYLLKKAYKSD